MIHYSSANRGLSVCPCLGFTTQTHTNKQVNKKTGPQGPVPLKA